MAQLASAIYARLNELDVTGCSRAAWIYLHLKDFGRAMELAKRGLKIDPHDQHCQNLIDKLSADRP